ncbi:MAG TPA: hypothetical protein VFZ73_05910 [Gemmatimonadaceae bacterium]
METLYALAALQGHDLMRRQFDTPEWQHYAAALGAREPWHVRFAERIKRLKLLAGQSSAAVAAPGSS